MRNFINSIGAGVIGYESKVAPRFGKIVMVHDAD
jgi:hypothetical protein